MSADTKGILDARKLPDAEFDELWDAVVVDPTLKDKLLAQAVLNFTARPKLPRSRLPFHGIIVLVGPPGTGKTTLARGLASRAASSLKRAGPFQYLEIEPHALASAALGRSQQAVKHILGSVIAEHAASGPCVVVLDEVETLAADRAKMSLEANPIDVHRATDAVLAQLDHLAEQYSELLFIATSNFPGAIDSAFLSRADLVVTVGLPDVEACRRIVVDTVEALAEAFPKLRPLAEDSTMTKVAKAAVGLDGRRIRKAVISALALDKSTAVDPSKLTANAVLRAMEDAHSEAHIAGRKK